jgi:hypothetical protein
MDGLCDCIARYFIFIAMIALYANKANEKIKERDNESHTSKGLKMYHPRALTIPKERQSNIPCGSIALSLSILKSRTLDRTIMY